MSVVRPLGDMMRHVRLLARMAKATETDLIRALDSSDPDAPDWADMIDTCRRCPDVPACEAWLARHDHAEAAPAICANRDSYAALKSRAPG